MAGSKTWIVVLSDGDTYSSLSEATLRLVYTKDLKLGSAKTIEALETVNLEKLLDLRSSIDPAPKQRRKRR